MASGDTLCILLPQDNAPPATNFATLDTRNGHLVLDFDAATSESAIFTGVLPRNYAGGGVTVTLHAMATSAITGDYVWDVAFEAEGTDNDADSFATANTGTTTCSGTSGIETTTAIAFTNGAQMDSLAVGQRFRLKVTRDVTDAADTMAGDLEATAIEVRES